MIVKYCIVPHDADVVLRYFNIDTDDYDSISDYSYAVRDIVYNICADLNISVSQVEIFKKYYGFCGEV